MPSSTLQGVWSLYELIYMFILQNTWVDTEPELQLVIFF